MSSRMDGLQDELAEERAGHETTKQQLENMKQQLEAAEKVNKNYIQYSDGSYMYKRFILKSSVWLWVKTASHIPKMSLFRRNLRNKETFVCATWLKCFFTLSPLFPLNL